MPDFSFDGLKARDQRAQAFQVFQRHVLSHDSPAGFRIRPYGGELVGRLDAKHVIGSPKVFLCAVPAKSRYISLYLRDQASVLYDFFPQISHVKYLIWIGPLCVGPINI